MATNSKSVSLQMRVLHRYLGFFLAGIMAVYAISGIILIFRDVDGFKKTQTFEKQIASNIAQADLGKALNIRRLNVSKVEGDLYYFKEGTYNAATGEAKYSLKKYPYLIDKMAHLHKAKSGEPLFFLNIFFGVGLLFFVISSFWMFMPSTSVFRKGMYFTIAGVILTLLLLFL